MKPAEPHSGPRAPTRGLLVDNFDSYTHNLFHLLVDVFGAEPLVLTNDAREWDGLDLGAFDYAVLSPGPGRPGVSRDVGRCGEVLRRRDLPVLGVCLGHQIIGHHCGATVTRTPRTRHGFASRIRHIGTDLFAGVPQGFRAVRYHSLYLPEPLPPELEAHAWADDDLLMAMRHRVLPWWSVQFHPESIASEYGRRLVANFASMSGLHTVGPKQPPIRRSRPGRELSPATSVPLERLDVCMRVIDAAVDTERAFDAVFRCSRYAAWLDSSAVRAGYSRFSFLAAPMGELGEVISYRVGESCVRVRQPSGTERLEAGDVFAALNRRLRAVRLVAEDLPFDLTAGLVGYFGYELKADCGSSNRHRSPTDDARWMLVDRVVAVDHVEQRTYLVALVRDRVRDRETATRWLDDTEGVLRRLPSASAPAHTGTGAGGDWVVSWDRQRYKEAVAECLSEIAAGESYEVCLTTRASCPAPASPAGWYRQLRRRNPAPYAALLRFDDLVVMSSSPERFLRVRRDGTAESRPIKGTAARSPQPDRDMELRTMLASDAKAYAENLMIVDLVRNDLGRVCEPGSVRVPDFMVVESYATVHQLVTGVQGRLRAGVSAVDAARACFPPGSMTGAPKLRTMEIIDLLEEEARGVYSGALGYFAFNGTADLSVVIRTAVVASGELLVGAGGAVVADSDPDEEYEEMLLKAAAILGARVVRSS